MKRFSFLFLASALLCPAVGHAQDAATEERLNKLSGKIEDLIAAHETFRKHLTDLSRELQALREQQGKPSPNYAAQEDLQRVADAVKEVDRKRVEDNEKVRSELLKIAKLLNAPPIRKTADPGPTEKAHIPDKGYEYVIQKDDTLSAIVQAYREKNIKVSIDQILKANPGLKPEKMQLGQKIFIPAPQ
jgi:septal ring factor EnvC (AmiA/AmiB activator)